MERLEVENLSGDELLREVERSAKRAIKEKLGEMREPIERFAENAYLLKTWLTLEEVANYAGVSLPKLRDWRKNGLPEAELASRIYIKREDLDAFIASHAEDRYEE